MAVGKLSPRQKMINMMYLVLTALLALNVSKEVLNSFFEQFEMTERVIDVTENNITESYLELDSAKNQERIKPYKKLADAIKPDASELFYFIQDMKYSLVLKADDKVFLGKHLDEEGEEIKDNIFTKPYSDLDSTELNIYDSTGKFLQRKTIAFLNAKDDRHSSGDIFNPENKSNLPQTDGEGQATQLRNQIKSYKELLISILEESRDSSLIPLWNINNLNLLIEEINTTLDIREGNTYGDKDNRRTWEYHNFYDMPAVASLNFLASWQSNIKTAQLRVINFLIENSDESIITCTIPESTVILKGDEFESKIFKELRKGE